MVKKIFIFIIGMLFGIALGMIPRVFEGIANTNICVESCPASLMTISIFIYALLPIAWGIIFVKTIGRPNTTKILLILAGFSFLLMLFLTSLLHAYQHPASFIRKLIS
jgi:hypothetical protein